MDESAQNHYLAKIMKRHFFAFLALLTGLAAFGAPAEASFAHALSCDTSISASAGDDAVRSEAGRGETPPASLRARCAATPAVPARPASATLRLPVLMGIERAYE